MNIFNEWRIHQLISPSHLFKSLEEAKEFLEISATVRDLECFLEVCEEEEQYEICGMIKNKIESK